MDKKGMLMELLEMLAYVVCVLLLSFFLHWFVGQHVEVDGTSMQNTLDHGEHLILEKLSYRFGNPKRFDIIVFRPFEEERDTFYIKRIIGLPGETVQIDEDGVIYINGEPLEEDYGKEVIDDPGIAEEPVVLGSDEYFVLGDNRNNSSDSRDERIGVVNRKKLVGRAWVRIWPLNKISTLKHQ